MKKVVAIMGSPRKDSGSSKLAEAAAKAVPGADVKTFVLNDMSIKGCQACMACKGKSEKCVVKDDLEPVLAAVAEADCLMLATPIYIGEITAQTKAFVDRCYSFYKPDFQSNPQPSRLTPGKKMLFVVSQGVPDSSVYDKNVVGRYEGFFNSLGFDVKKYIAAGGQADSDAVAAVSDTAGKF